jgi:hypothetical protein
MHLHMAASALQTAPAEALLGRDHPLVRILERMTIRVEGMAVVAAILCGSVAALAAGDADARAVVIAAVAAEVVLLASLGILVSDRRACVIGLIAAGRAGLPLRVVEREQRRLLARHTRVATARHLAGLAREARREASRPRRPRPLYVPAVVATVGPELEALARVLTRDGVAAAGVAQAELLVTGHDSPLYGRDVDRLRAELRRIAFTLALAGERSPAHC